MVFDEVKIKQGLVYDRIDCAIIEFTDLGNAKHTYKFEQTVMDAGPSVTKQMLVFMVIGVLSNFVFCMVSIQHVG